MVVVVAQFFGRAINAAKEKLEADRFQCEVHSFGIPPVPQFTGARVI
jgi:hypothetical protein